MSALIEAVNAGGVAAPAGFRHEALFYGSAEEFLAGTVPFVIDGLAAWEPILIALPEPGRTLLAEALDELEASGTLDGLGSIEDSVTFLDMEAVGRNPARIIPAWRSFVARHVLSGRPMRGIGEPAWAGRSDEEFTECALHESLLNTAFDDGPTWTLLCPYDVSALPPVVVATARTTHPYVVEHGAVDGSAGYSTEIDVLGRALPEPPGRPIEMAFGADELPVIRDAVGAEAARIGIARGKVHDLVLAVHEIAANSVVHGGGDGRLRVWADGAAIICEITDGGSITDPLVGRHLPMIAGEGGRGVWLAHHLCDLVQLRSTPAGPDGTPPARTTIRLRVNV